MGERQPAVNRSAPSRKDHLRFCQIEGWRLVRSAIGKRTTHHETYELALSTGSILRTRISRPPDRTVYGASLWAHILRDQLQVSPEEFWECVHLGTPPGRGEPSVPVGSIPTELLYLLKTRVGLTDLQLSELTRETAIERMEQYWTTGQ